MVFAVFGDEMWVEDGCSNEGSGPFEEEPHRCSKDLSIPNCTHVGAFHDVGEDFNTRCCQEANTCLEDRSQHVCEPEAGVSPPIAPWHNFSVANQTCAALGARLCTKTELKGNRCCSKGGQCDNYKIWTSTKQCPGVTENQCTSTPGCAWEQGKCECDPYPPGTAGDASCPTSPKIWVEDGCSDEASGPVENSERCSADNSTGPCTHVGTFHDVFEDFNTRCCALEGNTCLAHAAGEHECEDIVENDGPFDPNAAWHSFTAAQQICADRGARLCTKTQLKNDICCGKGGHCDNYKIWTSTIQCPWVNENDCTENECAWEQGTCACDPGQGKADAMCPVFSTILSTNQACATFTTDATCTAASGCEWSKVGDQWTCQELVYYTQAASAHTCIMASLPLITFAAQCFV